MSFSISEVEKEWNEKHSFPFDVVFTQYLDLCHPEPFNGYTEKFKSAVQQTLIALKYTQYCYDDLKGCIRFNKDPKYNSGVRQFLNKLDEDEAEYYWFKYMEEKECHDDDE